MSIDKGNRLLSVFSIWIIITTRIFIFVRADDFFAADDDLNSYEYSELKCEYDLHTGGQICDCQHRNQGFVLQAIRGTLHGLQIRDCALLLVRSDTFRDIVYLDHIHFENINNLKLESYSLDFPIKMPALNIKLLFDNVNLDDISSHAIAGSIDNIKFNRCRIGKLRPFAINSRQSIYEIAFDHSQIESIESQTFKKLNIDSLMLHNTTIHAPVSVRTFYDLIITNKFSIKNCTFSAITSAAFVLEDVNRFDFTDNNVGRIEGEAFHANVNGRILIENNLFSQFSYSTFSAMKVGSTYRRQNSQPMEFHFLSNTIRTTDYPIRVIIDQSSFNLRLFDLKFLMPIDCSYMTQLEHNSFLQTYGDTIYFPFGSQAGAETEFQSFSSILNNLCVLSPATIAIIATSAVLVLILIIAVTAVFYRYLMKRQRNRPVNMVIPDGKTYRETQIVFQIENAGLLKTNL